MSQFFISRYSHQLHLRPLATKMVTSGILFGIGDLVSQYYTNMAKSKKQGFHSNVVFNFQRTLLFASFGCFMAAPVLNFHYGTLLPFIRPGTDMASTLVKVAVD